MAVKFPVLTSEIARRGMTKSKLAEAIGVSYRSFHNKMTGVSSFTWDEVNIIQERFFPDIDKDHLFSRSA